MRPRLLNPLREAATDRPARRGHRRRAERHGGEARPARTPEPPLGERAVRACDPEAERVRQAGGPLDEAFYTCGCGYRFSAAVSTTVACPHCGTDQAW
ncbi:MAG: hypothetical protein ACLQBB_12025 [Solirubrobacteraceae bacterium]